MTFIQFWQLVSLFALLAAFVYWVLWLILYDAPSLGHRLLTVALAVSWLSLIVSLNLEDGAPANAVPISKAAGVHVRQTP